MGWGWGRGLQIEQACTELKMLKEVAGGGIAHAYSLSLKITWTKFTKDSKVHHKPICCQLE